MFSIPPCLSLTDTKILSPDTSIHTEKGHGSGGGVRLSCYHVATLFGTQSHFLNIPHSASDIEERVCSTAGLACAIFTTRVSGISTFGSKADQQPKGQSGE